MNWQLFSSEPHVRPYHSADSRDIRSIRSAWGFTNTMLRSAIYPKDVMGSELARQAMKHMTYLMRIDADPNYGVSTLLQRHDPYDRDEQGWEFISHYVVPRTRRYRAWRSFRDTCRLGHRRLVRALLRRRPPVVASVHLPAVREPQR